MFRSVIRATIPPAGRAFLYRQYVRACRMRAAANLDAPMILAPTYADDGLISQHVSGFLKDARFMNAYEAGRAGVPWTHPGEIHFRVYTACWAASQALKLDGDFVECGVASGVLSRTICSYLNFAERPKRFYLFDTFKGIPVETLPDVMEVRTAKRLNESHYVDDMLPLVRQRFADCPNVVILPGVLPDTLNKAPERIAYLSIDLNNVPAEMGTIAALWDRVVPGGIVLLDDYAYGAEFMIQHHAWNAWSQKTGVPILTLPTGQGLIVKC